MVGFIPQPNITDVKTTVQCRPPATDSSLTYINAFKDNETTAEIVDYILSQYDTDRVQRIELTIQIST